MEYFTALTFALGIGSCMNSGDWCGNPTGFVSVDATVAEKGKHSIHATARHMSDANDFDRGVTAGFLEYQFTLRR